MRPFVEAGFGLLAAGYRGYSGNPGKPSEPGLTADARSLLDWAAAEGYGRERLVYYGESLGTAVAVKIARSAERRVGKEWVSTCRSRWASYNETNKKEITKQKKKKLPNDI